MTYQQIATTLTVEFYTRVTVLSGQVACPTGARLLDLLNGESPERNVKGDFVEFVSFAQDDSSYEDRPKEYVRKKAVQIVAVSDTDIGRGLGAKGNQRIYPFVDKTTIRVSIQLETYDLIGDLHHRPTQTMQDVLNEENPFLALTDVVIARENHVYGTRPFVAVNKAFILTTREERFG